MKQFDHVEKFFFENVELPEDVLHLVDIETVTLKVIEEYSDGMYIGVITESGVSFQEFLEYIDDNRTMENIHDFVANVLTWTFEAENFGGFRTPDMRPFANIHHYDANLNGIADAIHDAERQVFLRCKNAKQFARQVERSLK